jgi:hypothetical protein
MVATVDRVRLGYAGSSEDGTFSRAESTIPALYQVRTVPTATRVRPAFTVSSEVILICDMKMVSRYLQILIRPLARELQFCSKFVFKDYKFSLAVSWRRFYIWRSSATPGGSRPPKANAPDWGRRQDQRLCKSLSRSVHDPPILLVIPTERKRFSCVQESFA